MNQEQSTSDSNSATGVIEPTTTPRGGDADSGAARSNDARLSSIEARVDHLEALALKAPDLRLARVLELKAQIAAGTYQVPALQVADALLDYMRRWAA